MEAFSCGVVDVGQSWRMKMGAAIDVYLRQISRMQVDEGDVLASGLGR
jgi:hypothetical protein